MTLSFKFGDPRRDFLRRNGTHYYGELFLKEDESDVTIVFRGLSVPGHTFVFEDGCPALYDYYEMDDVQSDEKIRIDDKECSEQAVLTAVRFVYRGDIVFRPQDLEDVLHMSRKYDIDDLFNKLTSGSNFEELWKKYAWSFLSFVVDEADEDADDDPFHDMVWKRIEQDAEVLIGLDGFCDLDAETVALVLGNDEIRAHETSLFNACMRWASMQCSLHKWKDVAVNRRRLMQPFIHHIRFPLMSLDEFQSGPKASGVLPVGKVRAIEKAIQSGNNRTDFDSDIRTTPVSAIRGSGSTDTPAADPDNVRNACTVCLDKEMGILFQPCGHVAVCVACSPSLRHCPVCRKGISKKVRAFIS